MSIRILHIIPYHKLYPPMNGGQLRCFHLMDELSKHFIMDVLAYQCPKKIEELGYRNENIKFYSPQSFKRSNGLWNLLPKKIGNALRYRWLLRTIKGPATFEVLGFSHILFQLAKKHKYDIVIMEHLSAMSLAPLLRRLMPKTKYIMDAHNVDYVLSNPNSLYFDCIKKAESEIYRYVDFFWACSALDVNTIQTLNRNRIKGKVVPNGVDVTSKPFVQNKKNTHNRILFCGSLDYEPNRKGIIWFYEQVWPIVLTKIPHLKLIVVGRGTKNDYQELVADTTVEFIGEVEDVTGYYENCYIAIAPLLEGSGTRLKILEAMSFGNPVVSTFKGIEGIEYENYKHALVAKDNTGFAECIFQLLDNLEKGEVMRRNARQLIENSYSWEMIGNNLSKNLDSLR